MSASQSPSRAEIGYSQAMDAIEAGFAAWAAKPHNAKWVRRIDGTPIPNDLKVNIAEAVARLSRQSESHDNGSTVAQGERERIARILDPGKFAALDKVGITFGSWTYGSPVERGVRNVLEKADAILALLSQGREQSTAGEKDAEIARLRDCYRQAVRRAELDLIPRLASVERERDGWKANCQAQLEETHRNITALTASRADAQALTEKLERAREALEPLARLGPVFTEDQRRARTVLASLSDRPAQGEK
jgi:hypothetical protein